MCEDHVRSVITLHCRGSFKVPSLCGWHRSDPEAWLSAVSHALGPTHTHCSPRIPSPAHSDNTRIHMQNRKKKGADYSKPKFIFVSQLISKTLSTQHLRSCLADLPYLLFFSFKSSSVYKQLELQLALYFSKEKLQREMSLIWSNLNYSYSKIERIISDSISLSFSALMELTWQIDEK